MARAAAGLLNDPLDKQWLGTALVTCIFHELRVYNEISGKNRSIFFYRNSSGAEIDFIIETRKKQQSKPAHVVCLELKLSKKWNRKWEKAIRSFKETKKIKVEKMVGIYTGIKRYKYDNFDVMPVIEFLTLL